MRLDLDTSNLDWNNPTVLDFRYVYHLAKMCNERISYSGAVGNAANYIFNFTDFYPFGFFNFNQILMLYKTMVYLGVFIYFNPDNFDEKYWHNANNTKLWGYSLKDMCEIGEFDFFSNPLIPGQPLNYYNKFLLPIKKVLAAYKYMWTNMTGAETGTLSDHTIKGRYLNAVTLPQKTVTIDGETKTATINGNERVNFWEDIDNIIDQCKSQQYGKLYSHPDVSISQKSLSPLGYTIALHREQWIWNGYDGEGDYDLYSADVWSDLVTVWEGVYEFAMIFPSNCQYTIYLYQIGSGPIWSRETNSDSFLPAYNSSPWGRIIERQSGTTNSTGIIKETISLPDSDGYKFDVSVKNRIPVSEFYTTKATSTSGNYKTNNNKLLQKAFVNCKYLPLVVVDVSSKLSSL